METTTTKFARRYDREFKENAVGLVLGGWTASEVARSLGVSQWSLNPWVNLARAGNTQREVGSVAAESPEQREMHRLRQENEYLRRQRDILKKALGLTRLRLAPAGLS